jgi:hypothetical protein
MSTPLVGWRSPVTLSLRSVSYNVGGAFSFKVCSLSGDVWTHWQLDVLVRMCFVIEHVFSRWQCAFSIRMWFFLSRYMNTHPGQGMLVKYTYCHNLWGLARRCAGSWQSVATVCRVDTTLLICLYTLHLSLYWYILLRNYPSMAGGDSQIATVYWVELSKTPIFESRLTVIIDLKGSGEVKDKVMRSIKQRHVLQAMSPRATWLSSSKAME